MVSLGGTSIMLREDFLIERTPEARNGRREGLPIEPTAEVEVAGQP
jgi:hypothetical protein